MRPRLLTLPSLLLLGISCLFAAPQNVREHGAVGDGVTLDTAAFNRAIEAAQASGGGTVEIPAGTYLCHSIHLRSHVGLHLQHGAVILAAEAPPAGQPGGYDAPEESPWTQYQDFGHSHFHNSLIWGENLEDVSITGPGLIYGQGLSRGNGARALPVGAYLPAYGNPPPDVLEADGPVEVTPRPDLRPGPFGYPSARDNLRAGIANKALALKNCRRVVLRDFSILHGGHFAILATGVDNLSIENLTIDTNRDGMDIDACSNVRISRCSVNSPWDDGICLKSSFALGAPRPCENVTISDCFVSGFVEGTLLDGRRLREPDRSRGKPMGRIKLGTESNGGYRNIAITNCVFEHCRGLALEEVDGGCMEDIVVSNITMRNIFNAPLFIRLGTRHRGPAPISAGKATRIRISNLNASGVSAEHALLLMGVPGAPLGEISLSDINISFAGGGTPEDAAREYPELERGYPEPHLFGRTPCWGLFARHVSSLQLHDVRLSCERPDARPAVWMEDVPEHSEHRLVTRAPKGVTPQVLRTN